MSIFIEKYRPQEFSEVVGLDSSITNMVNENIPHLLFVGPAGTGKTTTAKIIIKKMGSECLLLNASDERGINVVREKVKNFAMTSSLNGKIKLIFLDEFDALTGPAQDSLRNMMEVYHANCRFIATANYENKIIDPLQSRFTKFTFKQPKKEDIHNKIQNIADKEQIKILSDAVTKLTDLYYPDIRKMVNKLQELKNLKRLVVPDDIHTHDKIIEPLMESLTKGDFLKARQMCLDASLDYLGMLNQIYNFVLESKEIESKLKTKLHYDIAKCLYELHFSAISEITFEALLRHIIDDFAWARKGFPESNTEIIKNLERRLERIENLLLENRK